MAIVEKFKQVSMYGLSAQKSGRCKEVTVSGGWTVHDQWSNSGTGSISQGYS